MRSLRLGPWLLVPWYERVAEGRQLEITEPSDAARLLRRSLDAAGCFSLRAFVVELDAGGPLLGFDDDELIEHLAGMIARRRVLLFDRQQLPMSSDVVEYTPEPAPREAIVDELESVEWSTELETEEPVWFEVSCEVEESVQFEVACELDELPSLATELAT